MSKQAWVTLATNDSYALGALVLANSLRRVASANPAVVLITPTVTESMRTRLDAAFAEVIVVDVLDSRDAAHLALLARPELGITFTKIHCWSLTQYDKCVFLDADTLVVQNCDELFDREELSAAPDVGWPDCFNSGVFVYRPSADTFNQLLEFATERGSFDGGDQGLLNSFFSSWAHADISKHLPFLYNVTSIAFYSYLPALKQYGQDVKIVHFIGNNKPWLANFNWESRSVDAPSHLQPVLQLWWDIFVSNVHAQLDTAMVREQSLQTFSEPHVAHYQFEVNPQSEFPWHREPAVEPTVEDEHQKYIESCLAEFHDPWENYRGNITASEEQKHDRTEVQARVEVHYTVNVDWDSYKAPSQHVQHASQQYHHEEEPTHYHQQQHDHGYTPPSWKHYNHQSHYDHPHNHVYEGQSSNDTHTYNPQNTDNKEPISAIKVYQESIPVQNERACEKHELVCNGDVNSNYGSAESETEQYNEVEEVQPRHPYDNYYLLHRSVLDQSGRKRCSHEPPSPPPTPPPPEEEPEVDSDQAGLAGTMARLTLGAPPSLQPALDEHTRRQGWEAGNIDYMGADSFANIWAKISATLAQSPAPPVPEDAPVSTPEPVAAPAPETTEIPASETTVVPASETPVVPAPEAAPVKGDEPAPIPETPVPASEVAPAPAPVHEAPPTPAPIEVAPEAAPVPETLADATAPEVVSVSETVTETSAPAIVSVPEEVTETPTPATVPVEPVATTPIESPASAQEAVAATSIEAPIEAPIEPVNVAKTEATPAQATPTEPAAALAPALEPEAAPVPVPELEVAPAPAPELPAPVAEAPATPPSKPVEVPVAEAPVAPEVTPSKEAPPSSSDSPPLVSTPVKDAVSPKSAEEGKSDTATEEGSARTESRKAPPPDKLNCQLKPSAESAPLLTPDSELEDAATLAQSIIASELGIPPTPQITSATPPVLSSDPALQDIRQLSVEEPELPTPPVSLAQIGILPSETPPAQSDPPQIPVVEKTEEAIEASEEQTKPFAEDVSELTAATVVPSTPAVVAAATVAPEPEASTVTPTEEPIVSPTSEVNIATLATDTPTPETESKPTTESKVVEPAPEAKVVALKLDAKVAIPESEVAEPTQTKVSPTTPEAKETPSTPEATEVPTTAPEAKATSTLEPKATPKQAEAPATKSESKSTAPKSEAKTSAPKESVVAEPTQTKVSPTTPEAKETPPTPEATEVPTTAPESKATSTLEPKATPKPAEAPATKSESKSTAPKSEAKTSAPKSEAKVPAPKSEAKVPVPKTEAKSPIKEPKVVPTTPEPQTASAPPPASLKKAGFKSSEPKPIELPAKVESAAPAVKPATPEATEPASKKDEASSEVKPEVAAEPRKKKVVKKIVKKESAESSDKGSGSSEPTSPATPVPPPRKKEKKPAEKK